MQKEEIIDPTHVQSTDLARFVLPDETNHEANMQEAVKKNLVAQSKTFAPDKIGGQEFHDEVEPVPKLTMKKDDSYKQSKTESWSALEPNTALRKKVKDVPGRRSDV